MRIEELYLAGFGRFHNKRITLQDGLNLIFGENEAGKTTLQHFIMGMLYGFFVPTARRKTYTEDYERYKPWNSDAIYGGTLVCQKDGRRYRIQRNFLKERESVLIFDADSGEDISDQFPYDPVTRLRDPGPQLCGVSRSVFCNTANVAQLQISPAGDFSAAWEDQILSLTETADSSLSLQKVCAILDQKAEAIGSPKRKKTPYGQAAERLEQLELERQETEASEQSRQQLRHRIAELEKSKAALEQQLQQAEYSKYKEDYEKAQGIGQRIRELQALLEQQAPAEDPDTLQQKIGACQQAKQMLAREEQNFSKWDSRLQALNRRYLNQPIRMQDVSVLDRCLLLAKNSMLSEETQKLRDQLQEKQQEFISIPPLNSNEALEALVEYEGWQEDLEARSISGKWIVLIVGLLCLASGAALGWLLDPFFYIGAAIGLILMICSFFLSSKRKEAEEAAEEQALILQKFNMETYEQLKAHCESLENQEERRMELMTEIQLLALRLQKASEENPKRREELDHYAARLTRNPDAKWSLELEQQVKAARELCLEFADMSAKHNEEYRQLAIQRQEVEAMEEELSAVLKRLGADGFSDEQLQKLREQRRQREQAATELELQQKLLEECLDGQTMEQLAEKAQGFCTEEPGDPALSDFNYKAVLQELAQLQGQLSTMEQLQRPAGEIREEMRALRATMKDYQQSLDAIALAKERLLQVSGEIRRDLTPLLGQRLSNIVEKLTDGKYHKVLLSRDLHIRLEDPVSAHLVPVTALSSGTMDLIYLAMRMELLQQLSTDTVLPLLLDDSFVLLDDSRTARLLTYLARNRQGQVLLLSCHSREETILKAQQIPYHRISLS